MKTESSESIKPEFNEFFEYWSNLAKTDPERCDRERRALVEKAISEASPENQQSLSSLFLYVEIEQKKIADPVARWLFSANVLFDQILSENGNALVSKLCKNVKIITEDMNEQSEQLVVKIEQFKEAVDALPKPS